MRLKREIYLEQIRPYYDVDLIKVITGVRRAGKSILLDTIKDELIKNGIVHMNIIDFLLRKKDLLLTWQEPPGTPVLRGHL